MDFLSFHLVQKRPVTSEMWKTKPVSHISTPPTTTDKGQKRRYTNIPLGTKDRSGHHPPRFPCRAGQSSQDRHPEGARRTWYLRSLCRNRLSSCRGNKSFVHARGSA